MIYLFLIEYFLNTEIKIQIINKFSNNFYK